MELKTVYRVEKRDGREGMYASNMDSIFSCPGYSTHHERHPCPEEDSQLRAAVLRQDEDASFYSKQSTLHYGFKSFDQLRNWLYKDSWLEWLDSKGYVIAEYVSSEAYYGSTQVIFDRPPEPFKNHNIKETFNLQGETNETI